MSTKKISLALGLALLTAPAFSKISTSLNTLNTVYDISVDDIKIEKVLIEGQSFERLKLVGVDEMSAIKYEQGAPLIPVLRFYAFADKASDIEVSAFASKTNTYKTVQNIMPVLPSLVKTAGSHYQTSDLVVSKEAFTNELFNIENELFHFLYYFTSWIAFENLRNYSFLIAIFFLKILKPKKYFGVLIFSNISD